MAHSPVGTVTVDELEDVPVFERRALGAGQQLVGPAIIAEPVATTWLMPGWQLRVHEQGHLLLERV